MSKRPRMGRNLNALLGGAAAKERASTPDAPLSADSQTGADASSPLPAESAAQNPSVRASDPTATKDSDATGSAAINVSEKSKEEAGLAPVASANTAAQLAASDTAATTELATAPLTEAAGTSSQSTEERLIFLGVEKIRRGTYQPRRLFDQELLQELADSIKAEGMIQPIIVRPFADGYELVAGERRWRAAQLAGIGRIPAIVRVMEDRSVAAVSVIENIQRKDLNPLEEASAFERLCDEFGMTHKAVAEAVGRSRASVTNLMRLLELHDEVKVLVDKGQLDMGHARALLGAPRTHQLDIARRIIKQNMTVRAVENHIRSLDEQGNEASDTTNRNVADPDIERLSKKLGEKLGAPVKIQHKASGSGSLQISYSSVSELQGILEHIR